VPARIRAMRVSLDAPQTNVSEALRLLVRQVGTTYPGLAARRAGNEWVVLLLPPEEQERVFVSEYLTDPRLAGQLPDRIPPLPLSRALAAILGGAGVAWQVADEVADLPVTLTRQGGTRLEALVELVLAARSRAPELDARLHRGTYTFGLRPLLPPAPEVTETLARSRVTAEFAQASFRNVVTRLMADSGLRFVLHENLHEVESATITLSLKAAPLEAALRQAIAATKRSTLTYYVSGEFVIFALRGTPPPQENGVTRLEGGRISVRFLAEPLHRALEQIGVAGGVEISIAPEVPRAAREARVNMEIRNVSPLLAARQLVRQVSVWFDNLELGGPPQAPVVSLVPLEARVQVPVGPGFVDPRLTGKLAVPVRRLPLRRALQTVLGPDITINVTADVPDLPITLEPDLTRQEALLAVIEAAERASPEIFARYDQGAYRVGVLQAIPPSEAVTRLLAERRVSVDLTDASFRAAITRLMEGSGLQYTFHRNLGSPGFGSITLKLVDCPLSVALQRTIEAARRPGLTSLLQGDVVVFALRGPRGAPSPRGTP
jgi:hypothetical protein